MLYFFALFSQAYSSHPNIYYRARKIRMNTMFKRIRSILAEKEGFEPSRRLPDLLP
jgi:hypothetical protein